MKIVFLFFLLGITYFSNAQKDIRIVFTSDVHFGLKKAHFRGSSDSVSSFEVNKMLASSIRHLGKIDYIVITGDIANREEYPVQSDSLSWAQFLEVYKSTGIPLLLVAGNHDVSNAIGYYRKMIPEKDASSYIGIYNMMMHPVQKLDNNHFKYSAYPINYSKNIGGIHFQFVNIWPDSANRIWMEKDLRTISSQMPVLIFVHDPPEGDPKHFADPLSRNFVTENVYEYCLREKFNVHYIKDWDQFLKMHQNIKGYFHGHSNYQEFYTYKGLDHTLSLPCFRVDSPMKGKYSSSDEKQLSYQVITIHPSAKTIEVRQCFWNREQLEWGESQTLHL